MDLYGPTTFLLINKLPAAETNNKVSKDSYFALSLSLTSVTWWRYENTSVYQSVMEISSSNRH